MMVVEKRGFGDVVGSFFHIYIPQRYLILVVSWLVSSCQCDSESHEMRTLRQAEAATPGSGPDGVATVPRLPDLFRQSPVDRPKTLLIGHLLIIGP